MRTGRTVISLLLISSFFLAPIQVIAETTSTTQQQNAAASAQVRQQFNPSASLQSSGRTFSGLSFSGVGGAIAGCTNIGSTINGGISSLAGMFKGTPKPTTSNTPNPTLLGPSNTISNSPSVQQSMQQAGRDLSKPSIGVSNTKNPISQVTGSTLNNAVPTIAKKTDEELKKANQREQCLNGVAYAVAKGLLRQVTDKTLQWVNTGFNGNPLYIQNIDSFMKNITDKQVSNFLSRIPNENPIFGNAIRSIITEQVSGIQDGLIDKVQDTPQARAYQNFQEDFINGGWEFFLDPKKSPIGVILDTSDELSRKITTEQQNASNEIQRNDGFLDMKKCVEEGPAKLTERQQYCLELPEDERRGALCPSNEELQLAQNAPAECLRWETTTPGSTIAARVAEVTTTDVRQLEQADQINEVLGSFFDQLLNKLLSDGIASLRGRSSTNFSFNNITTSVGGGVATGGTASAGALALGYQQAGSGFSDEFDISRPQHLRAVLETQYNYLNRTLDARAALNRIVPTLGALDYCIPGPNPTWKEGLDENVSAYFNGLQVPQEGGQNAAGTIGNVIGGVGAGVSLIPGVGSIVGTAAGIVGGLISSIFGGDKKPHGMVGVGISFFDKVTNTSLAVRDTAYHENNRSPQAVFENVQRRWNELMANYTTNFTTEGITRAFISVDPTNASFATGFVSIAFDETAKLPKYSAGAFEIDSYYNTTEAQTREAILKLEAIRAEANAIVTTAKARHITEQAAAGTPVNRSCIDSAYVLDNTPIVPVARQESSDPSPFFNQFIEANNYFYTTI